MYNLNKLVYYYCTFTYTVKTSSKLQVDPSHQHLQIQFTAYNKWQAKPPILKQQTGNE